MHCLGPLMTVVSWHFAAKGSELKGKIIFAYIIKKVS